MLVLRINAANTGQFERTLIVAEDDAYVSYLEGCTAPQYDKNQVSLFPCAPGNPVSIQAFAVWPISQTRYDAEMLCQPA